LNTVSFSMRGGRHIAAGLIAALLLAAAAVTGTFRMSKSSSTGISFAYTLEASDCASVSIFSDAAV